MTSVVTATARPPTGPQAGSAAGSATGGPAASATPSPTAANASPAAMETSTTNADTPKASLQPDQTPPRHFYSADPDRTPIASIKRPRSGKNSLTPVPEQSLSPLHAPKPAPSRVNDAVDDIFSPAMQALQQTCESGDSDGDFDDDSIQSPALDETDFNPWQFIASLPPYEHVAHTRPPVTLPCLEQKKKTVLLDLDETLVHCSIEAPLAHEPAADMTFPVVFHSHEYTVHVRLRPHWKDFLSSLQSQFEVVVFTASQQVYADALLDLMDPDGQYIHHRLFRESCLHVEGNFLKDLTVTGRDLSQTVLVDNSPHAFGYQVDNGIPIESWFDDEHDRELSKLGRFLTQKIAPAADVREVIRAKFQSYLRVEQAEPVAY